MDTTRYSNVVIFTPNAHLWKYTYAYATHTTGIILTLRQANKHEHRIRPDGKTQEHVIHRCCHKTQWVWYRSTRAGSHQTCLPYQHNETSL